jgi:hypothetical protein
VSCRRAGRFPSEPEDRLVLAEPLRHKPSLIARMSLFGPSREVDVQDLLRLDVRCVVEFSEWLSLTDRGDSAWIG